MNELISNNLFRNMSSLIRYFELIIERQDDWENERKKKKSLLPWQYFILKFLNSKRIRLVIHDFCSLVCILMLIYS